MTPLESSSKAVLVPDTPSKSTIDAFMEGVGLPGWLASYPLEVFPDLPVRLRHRYELSGCENLGEFLTRGFEMRSSIHNYGQKTEGELRRIVTELVGNNGGVSDSSQNPARPGALSVDQANPEPSFEILKAHTRPWTMISSTLWKSWGERLAPKTSRRVSDVATLLDLWWPGNTRSATLGDFVSLSLEQFVRLPRMGRVKLKTVTLAIAYSVNFDDQKELESIDEILSLPALQNLDAREQFILDKRLLVPEPTQMTLDACGLIQGVTRERIRQVEKIILSRLKESECSSRIAKLLEASKNEIFLRLSGGEMYLSSEQLFAKEHEFGGPHLLAIYLEGRTLRAWLDSRFVRIKHCWFCGATEEWATLERRLNNWTLEQLPLPESVVAGSSNVTVREARAYFECSGRAVSYYGYFLPSGNVMEKRAARLHAFIEADGWNGKDPALAAKAFAQAINEADEINHARHGYRAVMSTPSLFLASPGAVVLLHRAAPWRPTRSEGVDISQENAGFPTSEVSIGNVIRRIGPSTLNSIIEACAKDSRVTVTGTSVGVMVTQMHRFIRLAPGLYDIRELYGDPLRVEQARSLLLNEKDLRRYCFAKHSGEKLDDMFPLWDNEQEMRWAIWGKSVLASDVWGSLMAVSTPERWPAKNAPEVSDWTEWKRNGRWRYKVSWHDELPTDIPAVRDVLLVAQSAHLSGSITWIRANFLLGASQINERAGLSAVVLCIILGLLQPSGKNRWLAQRCHPEFDREWIEYENLLLADPEISWKNPAFQSRFTRAALLAATGQLGWIEVNEISVLRSIAISGGSTSVSKAFLQIAEESDDDGEIRI